MSCIQNPNINPWVYIYSTATIMSLIGQVVIVVLYFKQHGNKTCTQDLLLRMAVSDAILSVGQLQMLYPNCSTKEDVKIRCNIYNFMQQFGSLALCLNCFFMSWLSYKSFSESQKILKKLSKYSIVISFPIPLALAWITLSLKDGGPSLYTCYTTGTVEGQGAVEFFTTFYAPLTLFMGLSLYYVIKSLFYVQDLRKQQGEQLQIKAAEEILLNMIFYPFIFVFAWGGYVTERFMYMFTHQSTFTAEGLLATMNNSQGWMNSVVYIYNYVQTRKIVEVHLKQKFKSEEMDSVQMEISNMTSNNNSSIKVISSSASLEQ